MDLLKAIAEDQGFSYEIQVLGFDAAVQSLQAGQSDAVIAGMSITPERQDTFDFSEPYFDSGVVMGIKAGNEEIKSYEDLRGKNVAVKTGTEGSAFAESIKAEYGFTTTYFKEDVYKRQHLHFLTDVFAQDARWFDEQHDNQNTEHNGVRQIRGYIRLCQALDKADHKTAEHRARDDADAAEHRRDKSLEAKHGTHVRTVSYTHLSFRAAS